VDVRPLRLGDVVGDGDAEPRGAWRGAETSAADQTGVEADRAVIHAPKVNVPVADAHPADDQLPLAGERALDGDDEAAQAIPLLMVLNRHVIVRGLRVQCDGPDRRAIGFDDLDAHQIGAGIDAQETHCLIGRSEWNRAVLSLADEYSDMSGLVAFV